MEFVKYTKDSINGKFYPEQSEWMTKAQWEEFCERWGQKPRQRKGFIRSLLFLVFVVVFVFGIF